MSQSGKRILGLLFLVGLLLSACDQDEATTSTATPIPLAQQPSTTATARPTITASLAPTVTNTQRPTSTPTVVPTLTPTTDPNPFPEVPITSFSAEDYHLQPPDPELFLYVLEMVLRYNQSVGGSAPYEYDAELIQEEIRPISLFLAADLDNYYSDGLPNANRIIDDQSFASDLHIVYTDPPLQRVLRTVIVEHIQQHGFLSTDDFDFVPIPIDLDDALQSAWLVEISVPRYGLHEWIPFHLNEAGKYQIIDNDLVPVISVWNTQADVTHDLTGDGIPEVLLIQNDYLIAGRYGGFVSVNTWDGNRLRLLEQIDFSAHVSRGSVEQEIGDFDGDGREEIRIIHHHYANFDCAWDEIATYQWQGLEPRHTTTGSEFPDTPLCNAATALDFRSQLSNIERINLLENVLRELSVETAPSIDYLALLRVRLAALYAMEGNDADAHRVLAEIETLPREAEFIQFINANVDLANDSPVTICDSLYAAIGPPLSPVLGTDIDKYIAIAAFGAYPLDSSPVPDAVCPLSLLISEKLRSVQISSENDLVLSFANFDLPYVILLEANLDSDPALEQIGLIDLSEQTLVIMDEVNGQWTPSIIKNFASLISEIQHEFRNMSDDDLTKLLLLINLEDECGGINGPTYQERWLLVIEQVDNHFELVQDRWICENTVDLSTMDVMEETIEPPFWDAISNDFPWTGVFFEDDDNFYDYLNALTVEVIHQEQPVDDTLNSIDTLINTLPPNDPLSDIIRPRLLFTKGYHYELNDNEVSAVEVYLELIRLFPRSPWSWLAWMRLEPVQNDY